MPAGRLMALLVGVGGWLAWAKVLRPAPKRACDRIAELCGDSGRGQSDDKSCGEFFDALEKQGGENTGKTAQCVLDARRISEVGEVANQGVARSYLRAGGGTAMSCA